MFDTEILRTGDPSDGTQYVHAPATVGADDALDAYSRVVAGIAERAISTDITLAVVRS